MYDDEGIENVYDYNNRRVIIMGHSMFGYSVVMDIDTQKELTVDTKTLMYLSHKQIGTIESGHGINSKTFKENG